MKIITSAIIVVIIVVIIVAIVAIVLSRDRNTEDRNTEDRNTEDGENTSEPIHPTIGSVKKLFTDSGFKNIQDLVDSSGAQGQPTTPYAGYSLDSYWDALSYALSGGLKLSSDPDEITILVAGMLGQFMWESANYSTCDEFNLDQSCVSACSCGQRGQDYMGSQYTGDPACARDNTMNITASTTGGNTPMECKPGTGSAGCCWWGRGPVQLTGQHNYSMFNTWLQENKVVSADLNLCKNPGLVCTNGKLLWLSGIEYWINAVQTFPLFFPSLTDYTKLVNAKNPNAADQTWISSQSSPSFLSGIGAAINRGNWTNGADHNLDRICSAVKILSKLGKLTLPNSGCTKNPPPPPPYVPGSCGTWTTVCPQCTPEKPCIQCKTDPSKFQCT